MHIRHIKLKAVNKLTNILKSVHIAGYNYAPIVLVRDEGNSTDRAFLVSR